MALIMLIFCRLVVFPGFCRFRAIRRAFGNVSRECVGLVRKAPAVDCRHRPRVHGAWRVLQTLTFHPLNLRRPTSLFGAGFFFRNRVANQLLEQADNQERDAVNGKARLFQAFLAHPDRLAERSRRACPGPYRLSGIGGGHHWGVTCFPSRPAACRAPLFPRGRERPRSGPGASLQPDKGVIHVQSSGICSPVRRFPAGTS